MFQKMLSKFSQSIGYPLFWLWRGVEVKNKLAKLQDAQWLAKSEIEAIQWRRLLRLLHHAYKNVPYYHSIFYNLNMKPEDITTYEEFRKLPFLTKSDITLNYDSLIAINMDKKRMKTDSTGGSTGQNVSFLEDNIEISYRFANTLRGDSMAGLYPGTRFIELWGAAFDAPPFGIFGKPLAKLAFRRLFLSAYNLSEEQMHKYIDKINRFKPDVILAYPSPLYHFSKFISAQGIELPPLHSILTSAETLMDNQRKTIENVFGCKIFNRYGCREFGNLGTECEMHNGIHLFQDKFLIEILRDGEPVNDGEIGEIVVTDLHKYGMPFIRYRIGDLGTPGDTCCACGRGFPLLQKLDGRVFDIISTPDGRYISGTFWTLLFRSVDGIKSFQVIQKAKDKIDILLIKNNDFRPCNLDILTSRIVEKCGMEMHISYNFVDKIALTNSGKHRFVISNVPVSFN